MPDQNSGAPYSWTMTAPGVLAHRFHTPERLPPFTSLTVRPGQTGLTFINGEQRVCASADTHVLTGNISHTIRDGVTVSSDGGTAHILYHSEITLFDTRPKALPQETIQLTAADGEETFAFLNMTVQVADVVALNRSGAAFLPCADGSGDSELLLGDDILRSACAQAAAQASALLQQESSKAADSAAVRALLLDPDVAERLRLMSEAPLAAFGLSLDSVRLSPTERSCPYCSRQLSLMDIRRGRCSTTSGCGCTLHTCPSCSRFVRSDQAVCPNPQCREKLLWCGTKGCETFRRVVNGRFCPVCRRACYPPKQREFLRNE